MRPRKSSREASLLLLESLPEMHEDADVAHVTLKTHTVLETRIGWRFGGKESL